MFSKALNSGMSMSEALQYLLARECQVLLYTILIEACTGQSFMVAFGRCSMCNANSSLCDETDMFIS